MTALTDPPAFPTLVSQILHDFPDLQATDDPSTLIGRMLRHGGTTA